MTYCTHCHTHTCDCQLEPLDIDFALTIRSIFAWHLAITFGTLAAALFVPPLTQSIFAPLAAALFFTSYSLPTFRRFTAHFPLHHYPPRSILISFVIFAHLVALSGLWLSALT